MSSFQTWGPQLEQVLEHSAPEFDPTAGANPPIQFLREVFDNTSKKAATDAYNTLLEWSLSGIFKEGNLEEIYHELHGNLCSTDFYRAPASSHYHESFTGGLCLHSVTVAYFLYRLATSGIWSTDLVTLKQATFCALAHDWCKINQYEPYNRNVKDEVTGKWEAVQSWRTRSDRTNLMGHGEGSVRWCYKLGIPVTEEMSLAIRWHMGMWDCSTSGMRDYGDACHKYPMVHWVQFADLLSVTTWRDKPEGIVC